MSNIAATAALDPGVIGALPDATIDRVNPSPPLDKTDEIIKLTERLMQYAPRLLNGDALINYLCKKFPNYKAEVDAYLLSNN